MKIGIFAGTFDPIHDGHLAFIKTALAKAQLDKVVVVAEKEPYRKKPHVSWDHRQAMIERALQDIDKAGHDYQFASQLASQHTLKDSLAVARSHFGKDHEFYFLVGSDIFEHIHKWHDLIDQKEYGGFIVALRQDHSKQWLEQKIAAQTVAHPEKVLIIDNHKPHISSSAIRAKLLAGKSVGETLVSNVQAYIKEHQLYR